jgi:hypothetical protein
MGSVDLQRFIVAYDDAFVSIVSQSLDDDESKHVSDCGRVCLVPPEGSTIGVSEI